MNLKLRFSNSKVKFIGRAILTSGAGGTVHDDSCRYKGITIRKPFDCMIASVAIENDIALLHNDKDFQPIEKRCGLKVLSLTEKK